MISLAIVTICFNDLNALIDTVNSVFKASQDDKKGFNIEHVIIDGNSNDGTLQYLESLNYNWLTWRSEPDEGISDAFNKGILASLGDYVMILNAGDLLSENLSFLNNMLLDNPEVIFFPVTIKGERKSKVVKPNVNKLKRKVSVFHCGMVVRKDIYSYVGMYSKRLYLAMDYEWITRAIYLGVTLSSSQKGMLSIMNTNGISNKLIFKAKREVFLIQKKNIGLFFASLEYARSFIFGVGRIIYERTFKDSYIR